MDTAIADRLKRAHAERPDAVFSIFTLAGHALSGRIVAIDNVVVLEAGKERAEIAQDRIEAFSLREL